MENRLLPILGMACASCAANVERKLSCLDGINSVVVSLPGRTVLVDYDPQKISLEYMKKVVDSIGFNLVIDTEICVDDMEKAAAKRLWRKTVIAWLSSFFVMAISMGYLYVGETYKTNILMLVVALVVMIVCGKQFYVNAWQKLLYASVSMDTLVAMSTIVSFIFSVFNTFWGDIFWSSRSMIWYTYYDATVMIISFVLTGKLIEEKAKNKTASSIRSLMGLVPRTAHVMNNGNVSEVPLATLEKDDIIKVTAGEKIPVDGMVTEGRACVDESMITGEPLSIVKTKGDKLLAGTVCCEGHCWFKAEEVGQATVLANIIKMVRHAQGSKAPVQRVVDKISLVFVPVVLVLSISTFLIWLVVGGYSMLSNAVLSAVSVLVIACPCALGLATPTAIMVGVGKAARRNILIKDAAALEQMHYIDAMVIDKTGTLTIPFSDVVSTVTDPLLPYQKEELKPHAAEAIDMLTHRGIEVWLMSGDNEKSVAYWADKVGIKHYMYDVTPQDKQDLVQKLQRQGKHVAMVGDGINDSQALAAADVSIAMGKGTDVAMDIAQVTLMGNDLRRIPEAFDMSHSTVTMIRQNLFWAFIYNVVSIPLAAGMPYAFGFDVQITPMMASAMMAFSSVSVVLNSLRLNYVD